MRTADDLRVKGIAAAALFKPSLGGWVVQTYPGGIRRRAGDRQQPHPPPRQDLAPSHWRYYRSFRACATPPALRRDAGNPRHVW